MNTEQAAQQLRLAATILETGHPWEYQPDHYNWKLSQGHCPLFAIEQWFPIRLILATPPDGRPLHNPDNLTAEQVGAGYRLALPDEKLDQNYEYWLSAGGWEKGQRKGLANDLNPRASMRLPLSVPWPEAEKPDPYAELKKAHADGKVIQVRPKIRTKDWHDEWQDCIPTWGDDYEYRTKPEPAFQLPPPPPGMKWHREDGWKEGDLPQGWRPCVKGEARVDGDELEDKGWSKVDVGDFATSLKEFHCNTRTRRPLTFTHEGKEWTWHRSGEPMPCDGVRRVFVVFQDGDATQWPQPAKDWQWKQYAKFDTIIGWRYADEKKTVQLGPEDVPPGSVFRPIRWSSMPNTHVNYEAVVTNGVRTIEVDWSPFCSEHGYLPWSELENDWQINRSIPLTGKWDANAWEPCSKQI